MAPKINVKERFNEGEVDLSMSDLSEVPVKDILSLKRVHSLDLSNNSLKLLPKNFSTLSSLTILDLSRNELKELPEDFGNLIKLRHLDLYRNQLQHLPLSLSKLKSLKFLDLKDNPLVPAVAKVAGLCIDTKACQACAKNIVEFYTKLENQVAAELEMRNKDRQKSLELNQKKKQEEKSMKKKEKQKEKVAAPKQIEPKKTESNLDKKHKNSKIVRTKPESRSFLLNIFKVLFLILSVYIAVIFLKVYKSDDVLNSAKNIFLNDYIKICNTSIVGSHWLKNYVHNIYKQYVE